MSDATGLSGGVVARIADALARFCADPWVRGAESSVFLCGGAAREQHEFRMTLGREIERISRRSPYEYRVYYPEKMFVELVYGPRRMDLLSLEALLAQSVDAVIVIVGSTGTFAELGAFANHRELRKKLLLVVDKKHSRSSSFVNLGPVRLVRRCCRGAVFASSMELAECPGLARRLVSRTREASRDGGPSRSRFTFSDPQRRVSRPTHELFTNLIWARDDYLSLVYVLEPIPRDVVLGLAEGFGGVDGPTAKLVAETTLNILANDASLVSVSGKLSTTPGGARAFLGHPSGYKATVLMRFRLDALNAMCRKEGVGWSVPA